MTLEKLQTPELKINVFGQDWKVEFSMRNFAVLRNVCNVTENELLQGLMNGDTTKIPYAIWASTLVFAPFDPTNPLKVEKQMDLESIFKMSLKDLTAINNMLISAMTNALPIPEKKTGKPKAQKKPKNTK